MLDDRICYVCGTIVPDRAGIFHMDLGVLSHQGHCSDRVNAVRRVYDHSARGRWRSRREVLALLRLQRETSEVA
jgi:hypothetical protein